MSETSLPSNGGSVQETCPRCHGWVWHRSEPCNCKPRRVPANLGGPPYRIALGARLKAKREAKGMSLDELAKATGLSKAGLWQIEVGRSEPRASTIIALAIALDVSTDFLLLKV